MKRLELGNMAVWGKLSFKRENSGRGFPEFSEGGKRVEKVMLLLKDKYMDLDSNVNGMIGLGQEDYLVYVAGIRKLMAEVFKKVKLRAGIPGALGRRKTSRKSICIS
ncbi:MAG: hypothetical protein IAF02_24725 [Anaerolineae bacterium]|nr:hypothetical protein [Anaerolineae bacterium]